LAGGEVLTQLAAGRVMVAARVHLGLGYPPPIQLVRH